MQLGLEGIGLYWCIIECLYENKGYLTFDDIDVLSYELRINKDLTLKLINEFDLFKKNKSKFFSPSVLKRLESIEDKSRKNRENVLKRWNKSNSKEIQEQYESDTNVSKMNYYKKENKIKENKNKIKENILTTTDNIYTYIEENFGRPLSPIEFEKIGLWSSEYDENILKHAIMIAVMNRKATFAYVDGILKNWKAKGFQTLEDIKQDDLIGCFSNHKNEKSSEPEIDNEIFEYNWFEDENHD